MIAAIQCWVNTDDRRCIVMNPPDNKRSGVELQIGRCPKLSCSEGAVGSDAVLRLIICSGKIMVTISRWFHFRSRLLAGITGSPAPAEEI